MLEIKIFTMQEFSGQEGYSDFAARLQLFVNSAPLDIYMTMPMVVDNKLIVFMTYVNKATLPKPDKPLLIPKFQVVH